ncbi:hypothetical protein BDN70DRAFT_933848 [Pholiota conissans]|uniref:Uncharacterized protein n=1 Tax=Pholiota conissans TaxID=109636 RepID=A0A9P5YY19_9AGAR|nr:hypothetical protein BDN70DRAFT_933848 [Pholiota conissans]
MFYTAGIMAYLICASVITLAQQPPNPSAPPTTFHVLSGSNDNYFYRDNTTSAQLLLTNAQATSVNTTRRLVVALPAGNNGALVYFLPKDTAGSLNVELVNGSLTSTTAANENKGIQADLIFSGNATVGVTIVGAVRALRDYVEGSGTMHEIFNYTLSSFSATEVRLHRQYINSTSESQLGQNSRVHPKVFKSVDLYLSVPPSSKARLSVHPSRNGTFTPPTIDIILPRSSQPLTFGSLVQARENFIRVRVVTNETTLVGFDPASLFLSEEEASDPAIKTAIASLPVNISEQVSFLTFQQKFTAGGWRFLTYFGRDTMIALRMLMPILNPDAIETVLGAVIEHANSTGALCHEETIGDYASFINIGNGRPDLGNTPFYDYKGQNRSLQFLAKQATLQNGTYLDIINRVASYNINRAMPFFLASPPTPSQLLAFRPGQPVGNWRDSNQGTGYGPIPFDVNVALVPANLRAVAQLMATGILDAEGLDLTQGVDLVAMSEKWESEAPPMFEVSVDAATAEARLIDFVQDVSLDASLLGNSSASSGANVSFYALSLMADGTPVEVLNSDLGFNLMYGTGVSAAFLQHVVDALTPYPRGLLTNVGMVVANPAYDTNRTNIEVLDRTAYHGTVVWSFQQALMAGGIARQLSFCSNLNTTTVDVNPPPAIQPVWCSDSTLVQHLQSAQTLLWTSIKGASSSIYSEVWSYSFDNATKSFSVADLATLSPDGTESDAIQLWSYGFLGLIAPST